MKKITLFLSLGLAMLLASSVAWTKPMIIKLGHYNADTHPSNIALTTVFKPYIEEKTQHKYDIRIYPNNQIGGEDQVLNGIRNGTIEMGVTGLLLQNVDPLFGVFEWPYLFKDNQEAQKVFNSPVAKAIGQKMEKYGIKLLAYGMNGFRVISSNKKVEKFSDFKGLRIRVPLNSLFVDWAKSIHANPQSMPLSEVFTALEQKVIDAQENPYSLIRDSGLYEVQKYIIETNHMFSPGLLQISMRTWNKLSDEDKQIFTEAGRLYQEKVWELAIKAENEVKDYLRSHQLDIIQPDEQFRHDMISASQTLYEAYYKKYPWAKDVINAINQAK